VPLLFVPATINQYYICSDRNRSQPRRELGHSIVAEGATKLRLPLRLIAVLEQEPARRGRLWLRESEIRGCRSLEGAAEVPDPLLVLARSRSATQRGPETCLCANAVLIADIVEPDGDVCASRSRAPRTRHAGRWRSDRVGGVLE
jgi:hypothetical protein